MRTMLMAAALVVLAAGAARAEKAVLAGGCFWCMEANFETVKGVRDVASGYAGGKAQNPTYDDHEGFVEAVEISFDPKVISYDQILSLFLHSVDVTDAGGQFCDRGPSYTTAIFVLNAAQKASAEAAVAAAGKELGARIVTPIRKAGTFWPAEEYHQDYWRKSDIILTRAGPKSKKNAYAFYRKACGRDARVRELWGSAAAFLH
jgi:peptide-methionine (S)-S-oxide reductase